MPHQSHEADDRLALVSTGLLAQRRLARGLRLNCSEAEALIVTVLLELIRDGNHSVPALIEIGGRLLGRHEVQSGVADRVGEVHVEGNFPSGAKHVAVPAPIRRDFGDLYLALYGSFLPVPDVSSFGKS